MAAEVFVHPASAAALMLFFGAPLAAWYLGLFL